MKKIAAVILSVASLMLAEGAPQGMKLISSAGKSFSMGNSGKRIVSFTRDFYIDSTEVTKAQYKAVTGKYPAWFSNSNEYSPVESVTWNDAVLYCNQRSKMEGRDTVYQYVGAPILGKDQEVRELPNITYNLACNGYRLPSEAEWEYACRGGTTTNFYWGDSSSLEIVGKYAVYKKNSYDLWQQPALYGPQRAVSKIPNAFGLYGMSGNVSEWCHDGYLWKLDTVPVIDPIGSLSSNDLLQLTRVLRGGSWSSEVSNLFSAYRNGGGVALKENAIGFRTVLPVGTSSGISDSGRKIKRVEIVHCQSALAVTVAENKEISVELFSLNGRKVRDLFNGNSGSNALHIPLDNLASGIFTVVVTSGIERISQKIVLR